MIFHLQHRNLVIFYLKKCKAVILPFLMFASFAKFWKLQYASIIQWTQGQMWFLETKASLTSGWQHLQELSSSWSGWALDRTSRSAGGVVASIRSPPAESWGNCRWSSPSSSPSHESPCRWRTHNRTFRTPERQEYKSDSRQTKRSSNTVFKAALN